MCTTCSRSNVPRKGQWTKQLRTIDPSRRQIVNSSSAKKSNRRCWKHGSRTAWSTVFTSSSNQVRQRGQLWYPMSLVASLDTVPMTCCVNLLLKKLRNRKLFENSCAKTTKRLREEQRQNAYPHVCSGHHLQSAKSTFFSKPSPPVIRGVRTHSFASHLWRPPHQ